MRGGRAFVPSGTLAHVAPIHSRQIRKNVWFVYGPLWMSSATETLPIRHLERAPILFEGARLIHMCEGLGYEDVWRKNLEQLLVKWWKTIA